MSPPYDRRTHPRRRGRRPRRPDCRNCRLRTNFPSMSLRGRPAPAAAQPFATKKRYGCGVPLAGAISCRNPRLRTSSLPMSLRDPNGVVAISCRNYRPHTNLFARTVCRLRGRRAGMPRPTTVERTLAVGDGVLDVPHAETRLCTNPFSYSPPTNL